MTLPTVDELVATLKRSHIPTIVVEGDDDMVVYRWLEQKIGPHKGNILPCYGRPNLLAIYDRKAEFSHLKSAFVADKDMWLFTAIPEKYENIIWTTGYSIENDLYAGSKIELLLDAHELIEYKRVLETIVTWFAFEVEEYRKGNLALVDCHPNEIVEIGKTSLSDTFIQKRNFVNPMKQTIDEVWSDYALKVRGKILFDLVSRYLNAPNRSIKHRTKALYEICCKTEPDHVYLNKIIKQIIFLLASN